MELFSLLKNETFDPRDPKIQQIVDFILKRKEAEPLFSDPNNQVLIRKVIQAIIWMYQAYDVVLQNSNFIDFDDQKLRPYILLNNNPTKLSSLQGKYNEVIVDEFQDINKLDFEFIKLITKEARLVVTGDDDQAIYGFRGCSPEYILNLEESIQRSVTTYKLRSNYRSPKNIVYHSTCLIRNNQWREEKDPIPEIKTSANIKVLSSLSSGLEAKLIV